MSAESADCKIAQSNAFFDAAFSKLKEATSPCGNCNVEWSSCMCTLEDLQKLELEYLISRDISKKGLQMIEDLFEAGPAKSAQSGQSSLQAQSALLNALSMNPEDADDYFKLKKSYQEATDRAYNARICAYNFMKYESDVKDLVIEKRDFEIEVLHETIADLKIEISLNNRDNLDMAAGFRELQAEALELKAEIAELQKFKDSVLRDVYARSARGTASDIWESPRFTADSDGSIESIESAESTHIAPRAKKARSS
jgi:hypothetical protein